VQPLDINAVKGAVKSEICPSCKAVPFFTKDWDVFKVNENLMYCRCNYCKSAFKFKRRKLNHYRDSCGWEYIIRVDEGEYFGVRGYSIRIETFEDIYNQFSAIKTYFCSGFCKIDDLFKEILNDDEEIIFKSISRVFSDEKKYYKNEKVTQNWHLNEQQDLDDDDLLAELDSIET